MNHSDTVSAGRPQVHSAAERARLRYGLRSVSFAFAVPVKVHLYEDFVASESEAAGSVATRAPKRVQPDKAFF